TREGPAVVRPLVAEAIWPALRRSPTGRADCGRGRRDDPQRATIALGAAAPDPGRGMGGPRERGAGGEEGPAPAHGPEGVAPAVAIIYIYLVKNDVLGSGSDGLCPHRASGPEGGGDPLVPDEVGGSAGGTSGRDVAGVVPASRGAPGHPRHPRLAPSFLKI